jgi:hypothetical protein
VAAGSMTGRAGHHRPGLAQVLQPLPSQTRTP